jgi:UDP-2,3-diacylglucosamine pyrophosphatase LpxH
VRNLLVLDAVIVSDIHLGSRTCQAKNLCALLDSLLEDRRTARLILNGDVFDSIDFRRLHKSHWKVLSRLRKLAGRIEVVWLSGNHDGSAEIVSHLLGVAVRDEYILESGGQRILILHGHSFDDFLDAHPVLTWVGDCIYWLLQGIDRTHYFAKLAKQGSKTFLRCARKIEEGAVAYARKKSCGAVCCGHTHHGVTNTDGAVHYFNSGCWTEVPGTYLTVANGNVELHSFTAEPPAGEQSQSLPADPALLPWTGSDDVPIPPPQLASAADLEKFHSE